MIEKSNSSRTCRDFSACNNSSAILVCSAVVPFLECRDLKWLIYSSSGIGGILFSVNSSLAEFTTSKSLCFLEFFQVPLICQNEIFVSLISLAF